MKDNVKLTGKLVISLNGNIVREVSNLVVTTGRNWLAACASGDASVMSHMAIGTGTTAAVLADTALETEAARVALDVADGVAVDNTVTYTCTFPADTPDVTAPAVAAITEAGILDADTDGTLLARTVFAAVNKGETDVMTISWVITVA